MLVQWEGLPDPEATWEDIVEFGKAYPNVDLEDKVLLDPRSIDTPIGPLDTTTSSEPANGPRQPIQPKSPRPQRNPKKPTWLDDYI